MLAIRFQRTGRTNDPAFRIIVSEKARSPKGGKPLAVVGSYNPKTKHTIIDAETAKYWISKGAQLSGTVNNLFITKGIIEGKKVNVLSRRTVKGADKANATQKNADKTSKAEAAPTPEGVGVPTESVGKEPKAEAPASEEVKTEA